MKRQYIIIIVATIAIIASCTATKKTTKTEEKTSTPEVAQNITFEKDIKPITMKYCGGGYCHHGEPSFWSKYENIKKIVDNGELHEEVIEKKTMPQYGKLPQKEYNLIKDWLASGAKQ